MSIRIGTGIAVAAIVTAVAFAPESRAQLADNYFAGKTVRVVAGAGAGGVYGAFGRVLTKHLGKYLPGKPTMVLEHMTGAGGLRLSNWLYNVAPKDGSVIGMQLPDATAIQVKTPGRVKYDARKFNWLSSWGRAINVLSLLKTCTKVRSLEDAKKTVAVLGGFSPNSVNYQFPVLVNHVLGTKFKMVSGYRGGGAIRNAMDKCEVSGWAGFYIGWVQRRPQWIKDDKLVHLMQFTLERGNHPILKNVPLLIDLAKNDEDRAVFRFASSSDFLARALTTPPGTPEAVNATIDAAFNKAMRDPAFLADAKKVKLVITPYSRKQVVERVAQVLATPKDVVVRYDEIVGLKYK